jgi:hypothetical protein
MHNSLGNICVQEKFLTIWQISFDFLPLNSHPSASYGHSHKINSSLCWGKGIILFCDIFCFWGNIFILFILKYIFYLNKIFWVNIFLVLKKIWFNYLSYIFLSTQSWLVKFLFSSVVMNGDCTCWNVNRGRGCGENC